MQRFKRETGRKFILTGNPCNAGDLLAIKWDVIDGALLRLERARRPFMTVSGYNGILIWDDETKRQYNVIQQYWARTDGAIRDYAGY